MKIMLCAIGATCLLLFALTVAGPTSASDIGESVKTNCTRCHSAKRICLNLGVKSKGAWVSTIEKMVAKGAKLPQEQVAAAADYLGDLKPGDGPPCN